VSPRTNKSAVTLLLPDLPVRAHGVEHDLGGLVQPPLFLFIEMTEDRFARGWRAEMDVGGFPSHGVKQAKFSVGAEQGSQFDAGAERTEAANDPAAAQLDERIGTADGTVDDGLVKNFGGASLLVSREAFGPAGGRLHERLRFARDAATVPIGDRDIAGMAEAAESGDAVGEAVRNAGRGHEMFDGIDGADGGFGFESRERIHFLPETDGITEFALGDEAQPLMLLAEHKRATLFAQAFAITFEQGAADIFAFKGKTSGFDGEMGADGKTNQIDGVSHGPGFVEIVDAPDEAAFDITPRTKIFYVEIADGEDVRSFGEIGADLGPELRPAVVSGAKEGEKLRLHAGMFEAEVFLIDTSAQGQPCFKIARGFDDVHAGNDSDGKKEKSNEEKTFSPQRHIAAEKIGGNNQL